MPTYSHTCGNCGTEIKKEAKFGSVTCPGCHQVRSGLGPKDWDLEDDAMEDDVEYDPVKDRNKSSAELWGAKVTKYFNIAMRLDAANPSGSTVSSVVASRATSAVHKKQSSSAKVSAVKGGRQGGKSVMGKTARDVSGRGTSGTHQDEEWLHLWGDNLGGPSSPGNFVAGSYAANTEMLVIEQELALNITKTINLPLLITASCSAKDVAEYIVYKLESPTGKDHFEQLIDLANRYFTKVDYTALREKVKTWLKDKSLLDDGK